MTAADDIDRVMRNLLDSTADVERRLEAAGRLDAHELMFGLREVLLDLQRTLTAVAGLASADDPADTIRRLRRLTADFIHGIVPHTTDHLTDVLDRLDADDPDSPGR
jgi:hypothetical protein